LPANDGPEARSGSTHGSHPIESASSVVYSDYVRTSDGGDKDLTFHFCTDCGATVFFTDSTARDVVAVPVGAFADPSFPPPTVSVYESRRHPWLSVPDAIEHLAH